MVYSLEDWNDVWRRNQYFVRSALDEIRDLRVFFVEPPTDWLHNVRHLRWPGGLLPKVRPLCAAGSSNSIFAFKPAKHWPRRLRRRVDYVIAAQVLDTTARLSFQSPVLWVNDPAGSALRQLTGWPTVYDITDDWLLADRPAPEIARLERFERDLLQHADAVVACSPAIAVAKQPLARGRVGVIGNGVDLHLYEHSYERPADLPLRSAVYAGTLHADRLDVGLCTRTARLLSKHGYTLAFVGPDALAPRQRGQLVEAGALLLGPRTRGELPAYLLHADVLVVPHAVTPFTQSLDPIKAYEYRAARRPVVSTRVQGFLDLESVGAGWTTDRNDFAAVVLRLLGESDGWREPAGVPPAADWAEQGKAFSDVLRRIGGW